ncbi:MAG: hypothetical protein ABII07_05170 [Patescibacteria group bacterium]|nr:hypothetical protein [Patescibacteria group bacterium]
MVEVKNINRVVTVAGCIMVIAAVVLPSLKNVEQPSKVEDDETYISLTVNDFVFRFHNASSETVEVREIQDEFLFKLKERGYIIFDSPERPKNVIWFAHKLEAGALQCPHSVTFEVRYDEDGLPYYAADMDGRELLGSSPQELFAEVFQDISLF